MAECKCLITTALKATAKSRHALCRALSTMNRTIDDRIEKAAQEIATIVDRLLDLGFVFYHPKRVIRSPDPRVDEHLERIGLGVGPVPYAIAQFWRRIGAVDLTGWHPAWKGCEYPDGLVVLPCSEAVNELDEFLSDREARLAADFPYLIPISPDAYCKEDVSGGMWYNVKCGVSDDPIVHDEPHNIRFLDYLDLAIRWGGFPGLEAAQEHSWPVQEITVGLRVGTQSSIDERRG